MPDLREIKSQLGPMNGLTRSRISGLVEELPTVIEEGEKIKHWVNGYIKGIFGGRGLLVVTKSRLILVAQKLVGLRVEVYPLDHVKSVHFKKGLWRGIIKVFTAQKKWELENVNNDSGTEFSEYIKKLNISVEKVKDSIDCKRLINALNDEDNDVQRNAIKVLGEMGECTIEPLIQTLVFDASTRMGAAEALGEVGGYGVAILRGGLVKLVNNKLLEINGFKEREILEKVFTNFVSPEYTELVLDRYKKRLAGKKVPSRYTLDLLSRKGEKIPVEVNAYLIDFEGQSADLALLKKLT
jgi:PAS domain S-box-containing protein